MPINKNAIVNTEALSPIERILWNGSALYFPQRMENIREALLGRDENMKGLAKAAIQNFFALPYHYPKIAKTEDEFRAQVQNFTKNAQIQNFMTTGDLPEMFTSAFRMFDKLENYDQRWQNAFTEVQFDPGKNYFEILDVENGFTFDLLPEGARVNIKKLSGERSIVQANTYADGVGWTWEMIEDRSYGAMLQIADKFRRGWFLKEAKIHYGLLVDAAVSGSNANAGVAVPYSTTGANVLEKDILTLDAAANIIGTATKDLGVMADPAMGGMAIYCNPKFYGRLLAATGYSNLGSVNSSVITTRRFNIYPTYNLVSSNGTPLNGNHIVMCVEGGKNLRATKLPPTTYTRQDIESFSQIQTMRVRIAAAIGEPKQFVSVAMA